MANIVLVKGNIIGMSGFHVARNFVCPAPITWGLARCDIGTYNNLNTRL